MALRGETRTGASTVAGVVAVVLVAGVVQDLFFILTMLVLAQFWNLLAGYGGLVSVGPQAFVGIGACAMFGAAILWGWDPVLALALALSGLAALAVAVPTAFFAFRLAGAYFAIGTWVVAAVVRLLVAQWKAVGGGTGTSLPREAQDGMVGLEFVKGWLDVPNAAARDIVTYWLALALCIATVGGIYWLLRTRRGLALAAVRDNVEAAKAVGVDAGRMKGVVFLAAIPADPAAGLLRVMGAILGRDRWKRGILPKRIRPRLSSRAVRRRKMRGWPR